MDLHTIHLIGVFIGAFASSYMFTGPLFYEYGNKNMTLAYALGAIVSSLFALGAVMTFF